MMKVVIFVVFLLSLSLDYYVFRQKITVDSEPEIAEEWVGFQYPVHSIERMQQAELWMHACEDGINFIGEYRLGKKEEALFYCATIFTQEYQDYLPDAQLKHLGCVSGLRLGFRFTDRSRVVEFTTVKELLDIYCQK